MAITYGVDVSFYQTNYEKRDYRTLVNWKKLFDDGARFAIVRGSGMLAADPAVGYHVKAAQDAGFAVGAYHYLMWDASAEKQADAFLRAIAGLGIKRAFIDVEHDNSRESAPRPQPGSSVTSVYVQRWLTYVWSGMALIPGIYTRKDIWQRMGSKADWVKLHDLWLAWYGWSPLHGLSVGSDLVYRMERTMIPAPFPTWKIWQYSSKGLGYVGMQSEIDLNVFNGGLTECQEFFGMETSNGAVDVPDDALARLWAAHSELWGKG